MRLIPLFYAIFFTALLSVCYIARHNELIELQIGVPALEKEIRIEEAEKRRLELELALFFNPLHLEEVARKPEHAHLHSLSAEELFQLE